jgi:acylphosphatase
MAKIEAVQATVEGQDQGVGFRALVMKQAIAYNLAGSAVNEPNLVVRFTLQGDERNIPAAIAIIRAGTAKSSGITVTTAPFAIDHGLHTFTIVDWTSQRRHITNKYNLVFKLRKDDSVISPADAEDEWHKILKHTLSDDDLKKLHSGG